MLHLTIPTVSGPYSDDKGISWRTVVNILRFLVALLLLIVFFVTTLLLII